MEIGRNSWGFTAFAIALYAFLLAPVLLVIPISFSNDPFLAFPPQSWGIKYYLALPNRPVLVAAFETSIVIAATVTALSLAIGVPAAYALARLEFRGRDWLASLFVAPEVSAMDRATLLAGRPAAPLADAGPMVCACLKVGARKIETAVAAGTDTIDAIGAVTGAGTNCGSCRPEIARLIAANRKEKAQDEPRPHAA